MTLAIYPHDFRALAGAHALAREVGQRSLALVTEDTWCRYAGERAFRAASAAHADAVREAGAYLAEREYAPGARVSYAGVAYRLPGGDLPGGLQPAPGTAGARWEPYYFAESGVYADAWARGLSQVTALRILRAHLPALAAPLAGHEVRSAGGDAGAAPSARAIEARMRAIDDEVDAWLRALARAMLADHRAATAAWPLLAGGPGASCAGARPTRRVTPFSID